MNFCGAQISLHQNLTFNLQPRNISYQFFELLKNVSF